MPTLTAWLLYKGDPEDDALAIATNMVGSSPIKTHFLFTAEFIVRTNIGVTNLGNIDMQSIALDLKSASRPNITIQQEDINFYGYRTKVATRTSFGTVQIVFYEDALNQANNILWQYLKTISPLVVDGSYLNGSNAPTSLQTDVNGQSVSSTQLFSLNSGTPPTEIQPSTIGPLPQGVHDGVFAYLKVHHYYPINNGRGRTTYTYYNPKIESVQYTELDMSSNEPSTITMVLTTEGIAFQDEHLPYEDDTTAENSNGSAPSVGTGPQ